MNKNDRTPSETAGQDAAIGQKETVVPVPDHGNSGQARKFIAVNMAYRIAGVVVAAHYSRYHHLVGDLDLESEGVPISMIRPDPLKLASLNGDGMLNKMSATVLAERDMVLIAGRQAELIHYTLHRPLETDQAIKELDGDKVNQNAVLNHNHQVLITSAMGQVTQHWHEIECLAAWLTRQWMRVIPAKKIDYQLSVIKPDDHGLFP